MALAREWDELVEQVRQIVDDHEIPDLRPVTIT
jgi:hypothetical protein